MSNTWILVTDELSAAAVAGVALRSGAPVDALVFGSKELSAKVAQLGVASVSWYDTTSVIAEAMAPAIAERAAAEAPAAVICSDQATARVLAGAIAAKINAAVMSSVISVGFDGGKAKVERLFAEGSAVQVLSSSAPVVCTIADGLEEAEPGTPAPVKEETVAAVAPLKVVAQNIDEGADGGLTTAERVVGVGLGIGGKDNLALIDDLAAALRAEIACTLPLCDNYHWFEHNRVVGTSTQKISPRLYVTVGSSGAPQHMTGVRSAKIIVAVNNDPEAPIFRECAYGIVGDAVKVLPALTEAIKNA